MVLGSNRSVGLRYPDKNLGIIMSDVEKDEVHDEQSHKKFLVSMSEIGASDGRFKLIHGNEDSSISNKALAEVIGSKITIDSMLGPSADKKKKKGKKAKSNSVKHLKKSYEKVVTKNKSLRLVAPTSTVEEAKIARSATRQKFNETMSKWDAAVHSRRAADCVSFPLQKADMSLKTSKEQSAVFRTKTPLEQEVAKLLYGENSQDDPEGAAAAAGVGLSVREMRRKLNELAKVRAHEQYMQMKQMQRNKIKSKKYRRQLRMEKRKEMSAMEGKTAEEKEIDRVKERASLKHTKASKNLHFVAKHSDKQLKNQILGEKDQKRRELKAKEAKSSDEEEGEEDEEEVEADVDTENDPNNPWMASVEERENKLLDMIKAGAEAKKKEEEEKVKNVDPNDFLQVQVKGGNFTNADDSSEDGEEDEARNKMSEAFAADDDILRDFKKEAREKAEAKRAKSAAKQTALPGWGSWAGSGMEQKMKKKRVRQQRFERAKEKKAKAPKESKKDGEAGYRVIVNESAVGQSARAHQTSNVPFPFTSVKDYEASIRLPVGDTFIPRTSFKKLVRPKVQVSKGAIVEPVDKSELVQRGIEFSDDKDIDVDCGMF